MQPQKPPNGYIKLIPKLEKKEILDFNIQLPDGTVIQCNPPDRDATITIRFAREYGTNQRAFRYFYI